MRSAPKNPPAPPAEGAAAAPAEPEAEAKAARKERPAKPREGKEAKEAKAGEGKAKGKGPKEAGGSATSRRAARAAAENPNFRYIVRISGSDLDGQRATGHALTGVRGVGLRMAAVACRIANVDASELIGNLPEATVEGIEAVLGGLSQKLPAWMLNHPVDWVGGEARHDFGGELDTARRDDVNRMKMIRSYRGVRHERGQKVRGQRTRSNGRTGMAAGVLTKAAKAAAEESAAAATPAAAPKAEEKKA